MAVRPDYANWGHFRLVGEHKDGKAAAWGSVEVIRVLLDAGGDSSSRDINKDTPLSYASWHMRDKSVIDMLSYDGSGVGPDLKIGGEPA